MISTVSSGLEPWRFTCDVAECDRYYVVRVGGELDISTTGTLARALDEVRAETDGQIMIDLTDLTFCDCAGVRELERIAEVGPIVLMNPRPAIRRLLDETGSSLVELVRMKLSS